MGAQKIKIMQSLFAGSYLLLIVSTIALFKQSDTLSLLCFIGRVGVMVTIILVWLTDSALRLKANRIVVVFGLAFLPYLLTEARTAYLDVVILLILASLIQRTESSARFLQRLAYLSLALVVLVAALASLSLLPTNAFEWENRVKNSMGFTNPNTFFFYILSSAFVFFVYANRIGFFLCGMLMIGLYSVVGSRTFVIAYLLLLLIWFRPHLLRKKWVIAVLWLWLLLAVALGLVVALFPIQTSIALSAFLGLDVNDLTSNRMELLAAAVNPSGLQLLFGGEANNADSLYVYLLNGFGLINLLAFLFAAIKSIRRHLAQGKPFVLALACIYFTIGIVEVPFDGSALIALVFMLCVFFEHAGQNVRPAVLSNNFL